MSGVNRCELSGRIVAIEPLRHTPAGIAILRLTLQHESAQAEAGATRKLELEITCVVTETLARLVAQAPLGAVVKVQGFIAPRSKTRRSLELHVEHLHFE